MHSGDSVNYWGDISYKTLTDRGCLGFFDDGVELQDGTVVSDTEAIKAMKKHPTKKTIYGAPMLDYTTFPKVSYKPAADRDGNIYPRGEDGEPLPIKKMIEGAEITLTPADGIEMTSVFSIMLGSIKELDARVATLEMENADLKNRITKIEKEKDDAKLPTGIGIGIGALLISGSLWAGNRKKG